MLSIAAVAVQWVDSMSYSRDSVNSRYNKRFKKIEKKANNNQGTFLKYFVSEVKYLLDCIYVRRSPWIFAKFSANNQN